MTKPFVLTRIRQDVSTGKCVGAMTSPPRQHSSCSSTVIAATIAHLLHRSRLPWILEHTCDSWLWDVTKKRSTCGTAWHGRGAGGFFCIFGSPCRKRTLFPVGNVDRRDLHRVARRVCWDRRTLPCNWTTTRSSRNIRVTLKVFIFTSSLRFSFVLATVLTMNARRFQ